MLNIGTSRYHWSVRDRFIQITMGTFVEPLSSYGPRWLGEDSGAGGGTCFFGLTPVGMVQLRGDVVSIFIDTLGMLAWCMCGFVVVFVVYF